MTKISLKLINSRLPTIDMPIGKPEIDVKYNINVL